MTLIDMFRGLLLALWCHLRRIRCSRDAARTELRALDVVFGEFRLDAIELALSGHGFLPVAGQRQPGTVVPNFRNVSRDATFCRNEEPARHPVCRAGIARRGAGI